MKKLIGVLLLALLAALCLALSSCEDEPPEQTHSYGEWEILSTSTCTEKGKRQCICSCGETIIESIPLDANVHDSYGEWTVTTAPTCQATGVETRSCACGMSGRRSIIPNLLR